MRPRSRRDGLTLVELLITLVITLILASAALPVIIQQNNFGSRVEALRGARSVTRAGVNALFSDLRMVETSGGIFGSGNSASRLRFRVPYAIGVVCSASGGTAILSLQPVDSAMFVAPGYSGVAWRNGDGTYTYPTMSSVVAPTTAAGTSCAAASPAIETIPGGPIVRVTGYTGGSPTPGQFALLYRRIEYRLDPLASPPALPGQVGLYRRLVTPGTTELLSGPFASSSAFRFYVLNNSTPQSSPPGSLADIRGIEVDLVGQSERQIRGRPGPESAPYETAVFFRNRLD